MYNIMDHSQNVLLSERSQTQRVHNACNIVTYNKKYIFGLGTIPHRVPKTFRISCDEKDKGVFCYVNEATFRKP